MPTITRACPSPEATAALARGLADLLRPGDTILLRGPLGAGKTSFTRAIAEARGADPRLVSSPTFVVVNQYPAGPAGGDGPRPQIIHVDAYRLAGGDDLDALGWDRFFTSEGRAHDHVIALIEWPERLGDAAPSGDRVAEVRIAPRGTDSRGVTIAVPEAWLARPEAAAFIEREPTLCRTTGRWVSPTAGTYPFFDERARLVDLNKWFTGAYSVSREISPDDDDDPARPSTPPGPQ